jgi:hypothetical protein
MPPRKPRSPSSQQPPPAPSNSEAPGSQPPVQPAQESSGAAPAAAQASGKTSADARTPMPAPGTTPHAPGASDAGTNAPMRDVHANAAQPAGDAPGSRSQTAIQDPSRRTGGGAYVANSSFEDDDLEVSPEEVAIEAYSLYCARGYQDGDDLGDWLAAEQIVKQRRRSR